MTEHRRAVDGATTTKTAGPIDRLGHVLKADADTPVIPDVRLTDLEPYVGLRYLSKLFNPRFLRDKGLPVPDWLERRMNVQVPYEKK